MMKGVSLSKARLEKELIFTVFNVNKWNWMMAMSAAVCMYVVQMIRAGIYDFVE